MAQAKQFTLLLLYDKVASSLPVAQALKEKDIDVHVVQNAGELIQTIATRKTDMVGLSVNHASTPSLIRVLKDKTKVQIMVFGEDKNIMTAKKIDKAEVEIKIAGVANGYNIFMKIGNLVKKKEKETENARAILLTGGGEKTPIKKKKAGAFIVKGKAKDKAEKSENGIHTGEDAKEASGISDEFEKNETVVGRQTQSKEKQGEENNGQTVVFENGIKQNNGPIKEKSEMKKGAGALIFRKKDKDGDKKGVLFKKDKAENKGIVQKDKPHPLGVGGTIVFSDEALAQNKKFDEQAASEALGKVQAVGMAEKKTSVGKVHASATPDKKPIGNVIDFQAHKKKADEAIAAAEEEDLSPEKKYEKYRAAKKAAAKEEPIAPMAKLKHKKQFKEAVQRAGEKSFLKSIGNAAGEVGAVSKVCIVPVINPKEKGFLLFCASDNQFLDAEGMEKFKLALLEEMKNDAVGDFILGETYNIDTFEVNIADWADKMSQFSYGFEETDTGKKVSISFVKRDSVYPEFKKMDEPSGVYRVHIHTMPPMTPVSFNVFLYFIKNKRLIPYLKKGGKFTARQIQRLYKRGFKFLYIAEEDRLEFLTFYVALMINQDFQSITNIRKLA